ncbi:MAG: gephyrin-like molybdotransferase Glp [Limisphaerales bacterium]
MKTLEDAQATILAVVPRCSVEIVALGAAGGRYAAQAVVSPLDLPGFDASAMDGYAVRAADTQGAAPDAPRRLRVVGRVAAGGSAAAFVGGGEAVRIFTGAPLPSGADAVVMQEDARDEGDGVVAVLDAARPWENVRLAGEDIRAGAELVGAGEWLGAGRLGALAAAGLATVKVSVRPRVTILATGDELLPPGQPAGPGGVYESNRVMLAALLRAAGAEVTLGPIIPDEPAATRTALAEALAAADVVVTSGGVSVGEADHVRDAFTAAGGALEFWRVAVKPGKPFAWGRCGDAVWFGLPGNPVSAAVTAVLLVMPALRGMQGAREPRGTRWTGVLGERLVNSGDRRHYLRIRRGADGCWVSAGMQASHGLAALAAAEGLVDVPPGAAIEAGRQMEIIPLP